MIKHFSIIYFMILGSINIYAQEYERYRVIKDTTIMSNYLGFERNITITVPIEWQETIDKTYPLIIIFDRQNTRSHNYIINTIDYLTSNEQMPSSIIVGVESTQEHRYGETSHKISNDNGLARENEYFLFNELIPLAERKFKASPFRLFIGHSRYGYFTTSLLGSRIQELNAVISMSPFFVQPNVDLTDTVAQLNHNHFNATKYYRFGIGNDYPSDFNKMDSVLSTLHNDAINAKGTLFKEADHNATPGLIIGDALYEIFEFWSKEQSVYISDQQKDVSIISSLNEIISNHYGHNLRFSLGILNGKGWGFYNESEFEKAIEAWELLIMNYPNFSEAHLYIADAQNQLNIDNTESLISFKNNLDVSTFYSQHEKQELLRELEELKK